MKSQSIFGILFLGLSVCLSQADGQGRCTLQNIAGTYAFNSTGSSTIVTGQADTFHWNALHAPIAMVGIFTLKPDGSAAGRYWRIAGSSNLGLNPVVWQGSVAVKDDCTGVLEYGYGSYPLKEKFVVLDNGAEIRAVAMQKVPSTAAWLTTAKRIAGACGQQAVHGQYLFSCKNMFTPPGAPVSLAGALNIFMQISPGGQYSGVLNGSVGDSYLEFPVAGSMTVNDDCTVEGTQTTPVEISPATNYGKGVFFDQGRQGYFMPLINRLPNGNATPQVYGSCDITLLNR